MSADWRTEGTLDKDKDCTRTVNALPLAGRILAVATTLLATACSDGRALDLGTVRRPIINGVRDTTHPGVVAFLQSTGSCTGTIVKTDVATGIGFVLTAAHCVDRPVVTLGPWDYVVFEGEDWAAPTAKPFDVYDYTFDPKYAGPPGGEYDFAVLRILGVGAATPVVPMVSAGEDTLGPGSTVLSIGFGQTTDSGSDANTLRYSISKTITLSDTRYLLYPNAGGGLCYGDSGGGTLATIGGVEKLIGINKGLSDATCSTGNSYIERASHDLVWIQAQLALPPPPASCGLCMRNVSSGEGTCMTADSACSWNADCSNFRACFEKCSDDACRIACESKYPVGVGPYYALARCQCDGCSATCAAAPRCTLLPKSKCGYPFEPTTCSSCLEARCCTQIGACADDGQCHDCLAEHDAPHGCTSNALRSALRACAEAQCAVQCAPPDAGAADADAVPESGLDSQVDAPSGPTTNDATDNGPFEGSCTWGSSPRYGSAWLFCTTLLAIAGSFAHRRRGSRGNDSRHPSHERGRIER